MKRIVLLLTLIVSPFLSICMAQTNREARVTYVLQNLGVNRDTQKKLRPLLADYLAEKKKANEPYDALKAKLKTKIELESISNADADKLLAAKWEAATRELVVKKEYDKKFRTVLSPKKTYRCFDLLNDKKSKVLGKKKGGNDEDDE